VMVSHASVGQLVRRVLGSRIETQRQALREALTASDGVVAAGLVPELPAAPERSHPSFSSSGRFPTHPSEPPTSSSISSKSSTPHPQSLELMPRRSSSLMPVLVALAGLVAAGSAVWFVNNQQPAPLPSSGASLPTKLDSDGKPRPDAYTREPGPSGVNINNLPIDSANPDHGAAPRPGHPGKVGEPVVHSAKPGKGDKADKADKEDPKADKDKEEEVEKEPEAPQEPELEPPPTEKPPPPDQRAPLNRASALTALSAAAGNAASCKRDGGPTGVGSVSVTFSPDGPVKSVNVSAPFGGTAVGNCVQTVFRNVRVAPFSGSAITLSKSFRIAD
jgi:hypothetical protein